MPFDASRRRLLALLGPAMVLARPAFGQQAAPLERPAGMPDDPREPANYDVGVWHIVSIANNSTAFIPPERAAVSSWSAGDAGATKGGSAELVLDYSSIDGLYTRSILKVSANPGQFAAVASGVPTRILADDRLLAGFEASSQDSFDLTQWFGPQLEGMRDIARLTVLMTIDGEEHAVYDVDLSQTAEALDQMRLVPNYFYYVLSGQFQEDAHKQLQDPGTATPSCFLTTACCELIGLRDDCFELSALRRFRDGVMLPTPEGRADVARYYALAPLILAKLRRAGGEAELLRLYRSHILPSAILARLGLRTLPWRLYSAMMRRLEARYLPGLTIPRRPGGP
jgi:hypothetical protein